MALPILNPLLIANWKMQLSREQVHLNILTIRQELKNYSGPVKAVICPSFTSIAEAQQLLDGSKVKLGAQDVFWDERGAYTGEVSPLMLRELGVEYVIIGHSERRHLLGETDVMVARKMISVLGHGMQPVLCVGETADERTAHQQDTVVRRQLTEAFRSMPPPTQGRRVTIAYEPIWAIGTGQPADPKKAGDMRQLIEQTLIDLYSPDLVERQFQILYGGSVDADNICDYVQPDRFGGALAGTASLDPESFVTMLRAVSNSWR